MLDSKPYIFPFYYQGIKFRNEILLTETLKEEEQEQEGLK